MNTRIKCLEVPTTSVEHTTIKDFARHVGMAAAVFARFAMFQYIETHDAREAMPQESRQRRDAPIASRASAGRQMKRSHVPHRLPGKVGGGRRVLQV